nr:MAG TPA: hypothetical protein [Caudoviricetes sp.]
MTSVLYDSFNYKLSYITSLQNEMYDSRWHKR